MAIYTTFFVCTPVELVAGLPGWKPPRRRAVRVQKRNPLTGELYTVESREPEWPDGASGEPVRGTRVTAVGGDYKKYLERRLRPFVRDCPHWAAKDVTQLELDPLLEALGLEAAWEPVLYPPPGTGALLQQLPPGFLAALRASDLADVAARWAGAMSEPEFTHSAAGHPITNGWTSADARGILDPIAALAGATRRGLRMYLLTEW